MHELWVLKVKSYNHSMWNDVDFGCIHVDEKDNVTYNGDPLRFQIPMGYTDIGVSEWSRLSVHLNDSMCESFFSWFQKLEEHLGKIEPYDSVISLENSTINLKVVDGFTQYFDKDRKYLMDPPSIANSKVYVKMEVSKKYGPFKDRYGLVCKAYQIVSIPEGCGFTQ